MLTYIEEASLPKLKRGASAYKEEPAWLPHNSSLSEAWSMVEAKENEVSSVTITVPKPQEFNILSNMDFYLGLESHKQTDTLLQKQNLTFYQFLIHIKLWLLEREALLRDRNQASKAYRATKVDIEQEHNSFTPYLMDYEYRVAILVPLDLYVRLKAIRLLYDMVDFRGSLAQLVEFRNSYPNIRQYLNDVKRKLMDTSLPASSLKYTGSHILNFPMKDISECIELYKVSPKPEESENSYLDDTKNLFGADNRFVTESGMIYPRNRSYHSLYNTQHEVGDLKVLTSNLHVEFLPNLDRRDEMLSERNMRGRTIPCTAKSADHFMRSMRLRYSRNMTILHQPY